jgi:hypothetical protein
MLLGLYRPYECLAAATAERISVIRGTEILYWKFLEYVSVGSLLFMCSLHENQIENFRTVFTERLIKALELLQLHSVILQNLLGPSVISGGFNKSTFLQPTRS